MHPLLLRFLSHTFVLRNFSLSVYFCKILIFPSVNLCTVHKIPCLLLTFSGVFLNWTHKFYVLSNFVTFFVQESNCQETADTFLQSLLKLPSADLRDSLISDYDESLLLYRGVLHSVNPRHELSLRLKCPMNLLQNGQCEQTWKHMNCILWPAFWNVYRQAMTRLQNQHFIETSHLW